LWIDLILPLRGSRTSCLHVDILLSKLLQPTCSQTFTFIHSASTEENYPSFEVVFLSTWQILTHSLSALCFLFFYLHQLLREISDSLAAKYLTMFTSWSRQCLLFGAEIEPKQFIVLGKNNKLKDIKKLHRVKLCEGKTCCGFVPLTDLFHITPSSFIDCLWKKYAL